MDDKLTAEARTLLNDFNRWRLQTGSVVEKKRRGGFVHLIKEKRTSKGKVVEDRLPLFAQTVLWCRERNLDPRLWIYLLFRARMWTFPPQLTAGHLMSERMLERYEKLAARALDGYRYQLVLDAQGSKRPFDPNVDIGAGIEIMKRRFQEMHQEERCMRETLERTLGFHPRSDVCNGCVLRVQCEKQIRDLVPEFDIIALRRGEISVETARAAATAAEKAG